MESARHSVVRGEGGSGWWEVVLRRPDPRLHGVVTRDYQGYEENLAAPRVLREVPWGGVPVILNFGPAFRISGPTTGSEPAEHPHGFVAGLHTGPTLVESSGRSLCVQVDLTPLGAHSVLGVAMHELADRSVDLTDVAGRQGRLLVDRLAEAGSWEERFQVVDAFLIRRMHVARAMSGEIDWAWRAIERSAGTAPIGALAQELGWSRKRLIDRFRVEVGLPPKTVARILRFQRAYRLLGHLEGGSLASIAYECGYYDQAHFNRDARQFAGVSPALLVAEAAARSFPLPDPVPADG